MLQPGVEKNYQPRPYSGQLAPDDIHTPAIYVTRIFQARDLEKPIEKRTTRKRGS